MPVFLLRYPVCHFPHIFLEEFVEWGSSLSNFGSLIQSFCQFSRLVIWFDYVWLSTTLCRCPVTILCIQLHLCFSRISSGYHLLARSHLFIISFFVSLFLYFSISLFLFFVIYAALWVMVPLLACFCIAISYAYCIYWQYRRDPSGVLGPCCEGGPYQHIPRSETQSHLWIVNFSLFPFFILIDELENRQSPHPFLDLVSTDIRLSTEFSARHKLIIDKSFGRRSLFLSFLFPPC